MINDMNDKPYPISLQESLNIIGFWGILFGVLIAAGVSFLYSFITIILPFFIIFLVAQVRMWRTNEYEFVKRDHLTKYIYYINKIKPGGKIYLTHFRRAIPSNAYLEAIHEAKNRNVKIHRVVGTKKSDLEKYEWTKWIIPEIEKGYATHSFLDLGEKNIFFEIIIFIVNDDKETKIGVMALPERDIPEGRVSYALISSNKDFVGSLETMFEGYLNQAET